MRLFTAALMCAAVCAGAAVRTVAQEQNWTNYVRIGAYGLAAENAEKILDDANKSGVFGIEVDNDIPGRYESFLRPAEKLKAIRAVAGAAHRRKNKAFVYIAGTECITADADKSAHSVMKDHPDWVQRKITGEPALFSSAAAFWIKPGDEDVWISPYAKEWRKVYMERVRQIAATGIDGLYVDIPYWMTHFEGWEESWASFDTATVRAFREQSGIDARKDVKLGDFDDANFRKWIDFRIETMTNFIREIRDNARSVNPEIMVIPEIYPGIEQEATRVGADVYEMYGVVDAIAHEYEFGDGEHMAASRTQLDWFLYQAGMLSFRSFAQGKATWILNYSWDGNKGIDAREAMKNLAMSVVMAGANFWDAQGHEMAGSNDAATRKLIFDWIAKNEKTLYRPRVAMQPVGIYFSPKSRDYNSKGFLSSYRGALVALLQAHREIQVVTPRTLGQFHGECLVLPNVGELNEEEKRGLTDFAKSGKRLVVLGTNAAGFAASSSISLLPSDPARAYFQAVETDFAGASLKPPQEFLDAAAIHSEIEVSAPATVSVTYARVDGVPHAFFANFGGLIPNKVAEPALVRDIHVRIPATMGNSLRFLPFLGEEQVVRGKQVGEHMDFTLPEVGRGAVVWVAEK
jgi:hypothetical protein